MTRMLSNPSAGFRLPALLSVLAVLLFAMGSAGAQTRKATAAGTPLPEDSTSSFNEYRGVQLGMVVDDVEKTRNPERQRRRTGLLGV